jgi:hypothetical protein
MSAMSVILSRSQIAHLATNGALSENHDVLGQRACLIGEHVVDLTQIVRQSPGPRRCSGRHAILDIFDRMIPVNESRLSCPDELDRDVQRDRNDVLKGDESVEKRDQGVELRVVIGCVSEQFPVRLLIVPSSLVGVIDDATDDGNSSKQSQVKKYLGIHLTFDLGSLRRGTSRVQNNLCVSSGKEHDSDNPTSILQDTATQDGSLQTDRMHQWFAVRRSMRFLGQNHRSVQLVHVDIRRFSIDPETSLFTSSRGSQMRQFGYTMPGFQIGFSVQVLGLDETNVLLFGRAAEYDV